MRIYYKSKNLDFSSGGEAIVVLREKEAENQGIMPGDRVTLILNGLEPIIALVQYTNSKVDYGQVGLFKEIWQKLKVHQGETAEIKLYSRPDSVKAIAKRLLGRRLNYQEIFSIIRDISDGKLGKVETAYFAASGFARPSDLRELYYLTKAMSACGDQINLQASALDKHSIGGIPGNRTTLIVVPIIASLGLYIPKTSSRAITAPSGTADTMEVLAPVELPLTKIKEVIRATKACLVWGGAVNLASADDKIIKVEKPLSLETYDKMIVSIMAKKVAMGIDYLVVDLPYGKTAKVHSRVTAEKIARKFIALGRRFRVRTKVLISRADQPVGAGIGPALEARDVLRVLQQHPLRPRDLEEKSIYLAGELLHLAGRCRLGQGATIARAQLVSSSAWQKMSAIIKAQGGDPDIKADSVALGALRYEIHAEKKGVVRSIDNHAILEICLSLGAPREKLAGIHLHCRLGDRLQPGQKLFTLYAANQNRLQLGRLAVERNMAVHY